MRGISGTQLSRGMYRFLFLDKEFFGFTSQLSSFSDAERGKIEEAVITAVNNQEHKVVERVEEQGLLQVVISIFVLLQIF